MNQTPSLLRRFLLTLAASGVQVAPTTWVKRLIGCVAAAALAAQAAAVPVPPGGWTTTFGGEEGASAAFAMLEHGGFLYLVGTTSAADFPATDSTTYAGDPNGIGDIFVAKLDADGNLVAATLLGGSGSDFGNGIALTGDFPGGTPVLTISGWTDSTDFPTLNPIQAANGGKKDAVIAQFDLDLNLLFSTYLGGSQDDQFATVVARGSRLVFGGLSHSTNFPFPANNPSFAMSTKSVTSSSGLVVTMNEDRSLRMATFVHSNAASAANVALLGATPQGIHPERSGAVGFVGWADTGHSSLRHSTDIVPPTGTLRIFYTEIDHMDAGRVYNRQVGGSGVDIGHAVTRVGDRVLIFGQTESPNFPGVAGGAGPDYNGGTDAVLVAFGPPPSFGNPRPAVSAYLGGSGLDIGRAIRATGRSYFHPEGGTAGTVVFSGVTASSDLPLPAEPEFAPFQTSFGGGESDGFFGRLELRSFSSAPGTALEIRDLTYFGGSGADAFTSVLSLGDDADGYEAVAAGALTPSSASPSGFITQGDAATIASTNGVPESAMAVQFSSSSESPPGADLEVSDIMAPIEFSNFLPTNREVEITVRIRNNGPQIASQLELGLALSDGAGGLIYLDVVSVEVPEEWTWNHLKPGDDLIEFDFIRLESKSPNQDSLQTGESRDFRIKLRFTEIAPLFVLSATVSGNKEDPNPENNFKERQWAVIDPTMRDLAIFPAGDPPPEPQAGVPQTYVFEVSNIGVGMEGRTVELTLWPKNLEDLQVSIDGGPAETPGPSSRTGRFKVTFTSPPPGGKVVVTVTATPTSGSRASLTGTIHHWEDQNPENNEASIESVGQGFDYAVEIISSEVVYSLSSGRFFHHTDARLTLAVGDGTDPAMIPPASLIVEHTGENISFDIRSQSGGGTPQCASGGPFTTDCTFLPSAFLTGGSLIGEVVLSISDRLSADDPPELTHISLAVEGDGQSPFLPNNFAEALVDYSQNGAVGARKLGRTFRTVLDAEGHARLVAFDRIEVYNHGPGTAPEVTFTATDRLGSSPLSGLPAAIFEMMKVVEGRTAGVTITSQDETETAVIQNLAAEETIVLQLATVLGRHTNRYTSPQHTAGTATVTAPDGFDLTAHDDKFNISMQGMPPERPDIAVSVVSQTLRLMKNDVDGQRWPELVTRLRVENLGNAPAPAVALNLTRLTDPKPDLLGVSISPESHPMSFHFPNHPNRDLVRVEMGDFEPGQSVELEFVHSVWSQEDHQIGLRAAATLEALDADISNNELELNREFPEYFWQLAHLDYAIHIRQQDRQVVELDGQSFRVLRTRLEIEIQESGDVPDHLLPEIGLTIDHAGPSHEIRFVAKSGPPGPPSQFIDCHDQLGFRTACVIPPAVARNYFIDLYDRVLISSRTGAPVVHPVIGAITGDGEIPAPGNNNHTRGGLTIEDFERLPPPEVSLAAPGEPAPMSSGEGLMLPSGAEGMELTVFWPAAFGDFFLLQFNKTLAPADWITWTGPVETEGDNQTVRVSLDDLLDQLPPAQVRDRLFTRLYYDAESP